VKVCLYCFAGIIVREVDNEKDLASFLKSCKRVFVLFYSTWCPFCKSFLPIFEKHAKIEEKKRQDNNVRVVPTVILFEGAYVLKRLDGAVGLGGSEKQLRDFLDTCTV